MLSAAAYQVTHLCGAWQPVREQEYLQDTGTISNTILEVPDTSVVARELLFLYPLGFLPSGFLPSASLFIPRVFTVFSVVTKRSEMWLPHG